MKRIYKGKSMLMIQIESCCDLRGYEDVSVVLKKPDGATVSFPAVVKNVEDGLIFFDVQS